MALTHARAQPLWLLLKQQVIAACTRLVAKMGNVYVDPLVGKTNVQIHLWAARASQQATPEKTGVPATAHTLPA